MNKNVNRKGFTLIELLVVVLIIGILASVALPQYQKAVEKSRVSAHLPILKSIHDARELYYMANGSYTEDLEDLDISLPEKLDNGHMYIVDKNFKLELGVSYVGLNYCPENSAEMATCDASNAKIRIRQTNDQASSSYAGKMQCLPSARGVDLCKSLSGKSSSPYLLN